MGKCLFFDADGTILDIVKGTPEDTKLALQRSVKPPSVREVASRKR